MPSGSGGTQAASLEENRIRRSGGARKVVTMTVSVTALVGRRTLPTAAIGDEELQVKLVLRDVGSKDAVHRLTGRPELWGVAR
jgi:hypothetical protein